MVKISKSCLPSQTSIGTLLVRELLSCFTTVHYNGIITCPNGLIAAMLTNSLRGFCLRTNLIWIWCIFGTAVSLSTCECVSCFSLDSA